RIAAARQYLEIGMADAKAIDEVLDLISPRSSPAFATGLIDALGASPAPAVGLALMKQFGRLPPSARSAALRALLMRPDSTRTLLDALDNGEVHPGDLTLDQKESLLTHSDKKIAARAKTILSR